MLLYIYIYIYAFMHLYFLHSLELSVTIYTLTLTQKKSIQTWINLINVSLCMIHIHFHWYQFLHLWSGEAVIYGNSLFPYPWCFPSLHRESNWITCITARHTVCTLRGPLIHVRPFTTTKTMVISPAPFPPKSPVTNF